MRLRKYSSILAIALTLSLTACSGTKESANDNTNAVEDATSTETPATEEAATDSEVQYPVTIEHAYGETVINSKPERVVTISWGNQDVPLALGVVPVGVSEANFGVSEGEKLLPWTKEAFNNLGVADPVLFQDTDGLDFEAISDADPDVILASYSGITQEEYDTLSEIAPVVAFPTLAWQTYWREQIIMDATGMGMKPEGEQLVSELEQLIADKTAEYPQIAGKTAAFFYFNPTDLGKFYVYLPTDPRAAYLYDLGLTVPESVEKLAETETSFAVEISAENIDILNDVDVIIAYGDDTLLSTLQGDALVGTMPAVKNGAVALIDGTTALAASATPSALSIPATIDEYLKLIGEAANNVQ